jgi:hypothetical protein
LPGEGEEGDTIRCDDLKYRVWKYYLEKKQILVIEFPHASSVGYSALKHNAAIREIEKNLFDGKKIY